MRTKRSIITMICLLAITTVWAKQVSESQARNIAARFMASHAMPSTNLRMVQKAPRLNAGTPSGQAAYYVFNASRGGYVIVAGDDQAPAILGYSESGTFDTQEVPEAMQALIDSYAEQIDALGHGAQAARHLNAVPIAPLITAQWSQNPPYNKLLPFVNGKHAHVGCVATAMAQVMHFWKWPNQPTRPIPAYTTKDLSIYMPQLPIVEFEWSKMRNTYETTDTLSDAAIAAARLSLYCAQSVNMNFKNNSSSAYSSDIPAALINYYGYQARAKYVRRMHYTTTRWENMLYEELEAGRPVLYSGSKQDSGHAFICDGYDGNGMFHINWGWNGNSNGYLSRK